MSKATTRPAPPIDRLEYVQNIGRFDSVRGKADTAFRPLSLIYSENGKGKTTLCAILRSLTSGDPTPILGRKRLSATTEAKAVVSIAGSTVSFDGARWSEAGPRIAIFDDHFVDTNVHSGLNVEADHRKGVHELVVGEEGVRLQRQVSDLTSKISSLQDEVRNAERKIPTDVRGSYSVENFCALGPVENIEREIEAAKRSLSVLSDADAVRAKGEFRPFALPSVDADDLADLLGATLADVESAALDAVTQHFSGLGAGAEDWVSRGLDYLGNAQECPFCGKSVSGSVLISHYREYFSESYTAHKRRISETRDRLASDFGGDRLAALQRLVQEEREKREFWSRYFETPGFGLELDRLADAWHKLSHGVLGALDRKAAAPLEPVSFDKSARHAMASYRQIGEEVRILSASLVGQNAAVKKAKAHSSEGNAVTAQVRLEHLQAIQRRYQPEVDAACKDYLAAKEKKTKAEQEKARFRTALDNHRNSVFGTSEAAINRLLEIFNADFTLDKLRPSDARGVPSSNYGIRINNHAVPLIASWPSGPSFKTALSSGDRSTLALAFFFASLEQRDLRDTIVVIDDPISSLDEARAFATAQEIRKLEGKCRQLIVLSHSRPLLCQLWERADKDTTATIQIRDAGADCSTLAHWDIEAAAATEFDRLHRLVRDYAEDSRGDPQQVAPALRILLESFLRVAFVMHFPPGWQLGQFIHRANQLLAEGKPILSEAAIQELTDVNEYARLFHHSTHQKGWIEVLANVNAQALEGYARRVLRFITLDGRIDAAQAPSRPSDLYHRSKTLTP